MPYDFLKELQHPHLAKLIGSFEDPTQPREKLVEMVLSPTAEFHLSEYLELYVPENLRKITEDRAEDYTMHTNSLRGFFGCLASGLDFLQRHHISVPVSPDKIFVHKGNVMFPPSYSFKEEYHRESRSSIRGHLEATFYDRVYYSRSRHTPLGSQETPEREDIRWLGLIFLEILAAQNGKGLEDLCDRYVWLNNPGKWNIWKQATQELEAHVSPEDKVVLEWVKDMFFQGRPGGLELTARDVLLRIQAQEGNGSRLRFCGRCCLQDGDRGDDILFSSDPSPENGVSPKGSEGFKRYWTIMKKNVKPKFKGGALLEGK